jgi:hypothetical protein
MRVPMHPHPTPLRRASLVLVLGGAMFCLAPAAAAQTLVSTTGDRIPYRVDLPALAKISVNDQVLKAESDDLAVVVAAVDMMEAESTSRLPVSENEERRLLTNLLMSSDSLLFGILDESMREQNADLSGVVREIRTLGGQRAGYLRGPVQCSCGHAGSIEMYVTIKDGIGYMLMFGVHGEAGGRHDPLIARIHQSFVLADAPPPAQPRARRSSTIRRIRQSR